MKNKAERLIEYVLRQMGSLLFLLEHRTSPAYFSRSPKKLTFQNTTLIVLNSMKKAVAVEVAHFFERFKKTEKKPSHQAFAEARDKISYLAFKDFFDKSCEMAITDEEARTYKSYRLLAVDGTSFFVGDLANTSIKEYFGESTTVPGKAMCRIGGIVDVLEDSIVNAAVSRFDTGERALAIEQVKELKLVENALFLLDRGYWAPELVKEIVFGNGQKFLMRLPCNIKKTDIKNDDGEVINLRRYSFTLPSGEVETLLTNLSKEETSDEELTTLYTKRWGIETKYLELKSRLEIDNFSGQSANSVLQDIYATLYISNLNAFICSDADEIIEEKTAEKNNKYTQKANRSFGISQLRERFIDICLLSSSLKRASELRRLALDMSTNVTYVGKSMARPRDKRKIKAARSQSPHKSVL